MSLIVIGSSKHGIAVSVDSRALRFVAADGTPERPRDFSVIGSDHEQKMILIHDRFVVAPLGEEPSGVSIAAIVAQAGAALPRTVSSQTLATALIRALRMHKAPMTIVLIAGYETDGRPVVIKAISGAGHLEYRNYPQGRPDAGEPFHSVWSFGHDDAIRRLCADVEMPHVDLTLQDVSDLTRFLIYTQAELQRFALVEQAVGGEIDTAVVTPERGTDWIRRKVLIASEPGAAAASIGAAA